MGKVRIGVLGIGNIGTAHANYIYEGKIKNAKLSAICDISESRRNFAKGKFNGTLIFDNYRDLITSKSVDAVIVSVPHPMHSEIAEFAFENGVNVLLEKPVDITVSKARQLNEKAEKSNKVFSIMFNQRTIPIFKKAKEIVESGQLGDLKRSIWIITNWYRTQAYYNSGGWRATWQGEGGGVLLNQAPHNLDLWQWICGMPNEVTAFCDVASCHQIEVEDSATILTRYSNGATGCFITSTGEYPGTNRLEISGDLGKIVLENGTLKWWKLKQSITENIQKSEMSFDNIDFDYNEFQFENIENPHGEIIQNFVNAILFGEELISKGVEGVNELSISNAAYLSSWKNCSVKLPLETDEFDGMLKSKQSMSVFSDVIKENKVQTEYFDRWQTRW